MVSRVSKISLCSPVTVDTRGKDTLLYSPPPNMDLLKNDFPQNTD